MIRNTMMATMSGLMILVACGEKTTDTKASTDPKGKLNWTAYGEAFKANRKTTLSMEELGEKMESDGGAEGTFHAEIVQTCTKMGCWMNVKGPGGDTIMVYMKDHAFFVPLDGVQGNLAVIQGKAYYDTVSVDMQKHLLEDAGAPQADIDAVSEPKFELAIEAAGVLIKNVPEGAPMAGDEDDESAQHEHGEGGLDQSEHEHEGHSH